ncbi:MAG: ATP-binding domain-containing protein [Oscillospiraceae bacterium]|nr:ATP-binding domain-containing protein [Oscillospiraceae bacterium]
MAYIYPLKEELKDVPYSERIVYDLLKDLEKDFIIFHSVQWVKKGRRWKSTWKENDFLILNPKLGALVLEIKGGDIIYQDGVFHQINTETKEVAVLSPTKKNDPFSQAIDGVYHYRRLLDQISPDLSDRFPIEPAVWFSTCDIKEKRRSFPLQYREASGAVLGNEDFSKHGKAIHDIFDFYASQGKTAVTEEEYAKIIDAIAQDFKLISAPGVKKGELDYAFLKLTNEQTGLLDYISEQKNATIQGVAGTGKTLIAKEAARRLGAEGRKVLFLCFNRFLFSHLQHMYPYKNVTYYNIHTFISRYRPGEDTSSGEKRVAELQKIDWDFLDYDDIIIDEGQDFFNDEIIYFKEYMILKDGHFWVFYDKNQLLTTQEVPEWIEKSECRLLLTKNCRNTYQIALTSYNVIDIEMDPKVMMINGDPTSISFVNGEPVSKLARLLKQLTNAESGYEYSDIVILSLKTENNSILQNTVRIAGIPIMHEKNNSSILFTTASKFKGLESRIVIIIDIDESCFTDENKKRLFYVACSRATQKLALFINGDNKKIEAIANAIDNENRFAAKGCIAMKTKADPLEL